MKNMGIFIGLITLVTLSGASAEASYYRFWRGQKKADLSGESFLQGVNAKLLPITGQLAASPAKLQSYQPVIPTLELLRAGFPAEVALIEYDNQEDYQAYRATPEGKAYGDLHWELFEREKSQSLVPQSYAGEVGPGRAYDVVGGNGDWNRARSFFRVYIRDTRFSDLEYAASIRKHIDHVARSNPAGFIVLVDPAYVIEYVGWYRQEDKAAADHTIEKHMTPSGVETTILDDLVEVTTRTAMDVPLKPGRAIAPGVGVRYAL